MPRKPKSQPIAAAIEAAEHRAEVTGGYPEQPFVPGDSYEPPSVTAALAAPGVSTRPAYRDDSFDPATFDAPAETPTAVTTTPDTAAPDDASVRTAAAPARVFGVSLDERQGIKIEVERERQPGQVGPRVMVKFRNDMPPSDAEKAVLRAEGFRYESADKAWTANKSAVNLVVAKRAVNKITHELRGDTGAALFV